MTGVNVRDIDGGKRVELPNGDVWEIKESPNGVMAWGAHNGILRANWPSVSEGVAALIYFYEQGLEGWDE